MVLFSYPVRLAKWILKPSSSQLFLIFSFFVFINAFVKADVSIGALSTHTVWDSVDFWRRLQTSVYLVALTWTCFSVIGYSNARIVYFVSFFLELLLPESALRDGAHHIFIYFNLYKLFGYSGGSSTNPNAAWIVLLFLCSIMLLCRMLFQSKGAFYHFAKIRSSFFPFVGISSILVLTLLIHETVIGGMLNETKSICATDAEAILKEESIFNASCLYRDDNCAKMKMDHQGKIEMNISHKPQRALALATNDPSGDHPAEKNENDIKEILTTEGKNALSNQSIYNWRVNGFEVYSACSIKLDSKTALVSIDTHDFSLRFSQAQMRFHRLVSIASWVWMLFLTLHLLRKSKTY